MTAEGGGEGPKPAALAEIGLQLTERREELGRSIADAERDLKIRGAHLQALESGSARLPLGLVYQVGFLRAYAEYLGMDSAKLVAAYRRAVQGPAAEPKTTSVVPPPDKARDEVALEPLPSFAERLALAGRGIPSPRRSRRVSVWLLVIAALVLVLIASYTLGIGPFAGGPGPSPSEPGGSTGPAPAGPGGSEPPGGGTTPPTGSGTGPASPGGSGFSREKVAVTAETPAELRLEVDAASLEVGLAFADYVWIRAKADGLVVAEGMMEPGASAEFQASDTLELRLGRASHTMLSVFGVEIGPAGAADDARTVVLTRKAQ